MDSLIISDQDVKFVKLALDFRLLLLKGVVVKLMAYFVPAMKPSKIITIIQRLMEFPCM
jgi:hypothetical protein